MGRLQQSGKISRWALSMNETLTEYFEEVADANAKAALESPGDLRLAINAIMTLDGFLGTLHSELVRQARVKQKSDDQWKESLAQTSQHYRVLRDMAYALKHGTLTHKKPRMVRHSDQVVSMPGAFQSNFVQRNAFQIGTVWIAAEDTDYRAVDVIRSVRDLARELLSQVP